MNKTGEKNNGVKAGKAIQSLLDGSVLTRQKFLKHLPYILFIVLLAILYIANNFYAEKTILKAGEIKSELKEYRFQYISTKSRLMFHSKQSEVAKKLQPIGLVESRTPPKKIIINGNPINPINEKH